MSFSDANRAQIRVIEEVTWGTTPATGITREVRLTSSSLVANKETVVSDELRADRMVSDVVEVSASSSGDINFEFSAGAQDEFLAAFLLANWTRPMTVDFWKGVKISVTGASEITYAGSDLTDYLAVGRVIKLAGFTDAANAGYFEISAIVYGSDTVITVVETSLVVEAGSVTNTMYDANDFLLSSITIDTTATGFSSSNATEFQALIAAGQLYVGQKLMIEESGTSNVYTIAGLTDDNINTFPTPVTVVTSGTATVFKGSSVKNFGTLADINQRKFSLETSFNDIGQFQIQDGMVPGTFSLEIGSGAIVTGTMGFEGRATTLTQAATLTGAGYSPLDAQAGEVVNATTNVGNLTKDGASLGACLQSISLSGEAGLRMQNCVGSKFPRGIGTGRFNLTGSMTVYFEDEALFENFINHDTVSLSFSIEDAEGYSYYFTIPAIKISQDQIAPGGIDQDVFETIEFTAFRDAATDTMFQIDRFSPSV